ncbi:MAG: hypothetical protein ABW003_01470, partial [Microvirga sp.]
SATEPRALKSAAFHANAPRIRRCPVAAHARRNPSVPSALRMHPFLIARRNRLTTRANRYDSTV